MTTKLKMKKEVLDFFLNNSTSVSVNGNTYIHFSPWIKMPDKIRGDETVEVIPLGQLPEELKQAITSMREGGFKMPNTGYPMTDKEAFKKD